jgi:hypothetical protein
VKRSVKQWEVQSGMSFQEAGHSHARSFSSFLMLAVASIVSANAQPFCLADKDPGPITVTSIAERSGVLAKFTLAGKANCGWFFESTFPVKVQTPQGRSLWEGVARTTADWTHIGMHTFIAEIDVGKYHGSIVIQLMRDNPGGDHLNDKIVSFGARVQ